MFMFMFMCIPASHPFFVSVHDPAHTDPFAQTSQDCNQRAQKHIFSACSDMLSVTCVKPDSINEVINILYADHDDHTG